MSIGRIDHVAIGVADLAAAVETFTGSLGLRLIRRGVVGRTGSAMAMLGDGTGMKLELIETPDATVARLLHIALRSNDVAADSGAIAAPLALIRGPNSLPAASALSALLSDGAGLEVQLIQYDDDSPDVAEWPSGGSEGIDA